MSDSTKDNGMASFEENLEAAISAEENVEKEVGDKLVELTADIQRLQAEYSNYRKRVERDRSLARETAIAEVLNSFLPVLDDFARANEHGELTGAFKSVSDVVDGIMKKYGLETFGAVGEDFNPELHEAMSHQETEETGDIVTVVTAVYQAGFSYAGRVLRPARVAVEDIVRAG
jgi:molecular chaperone GrpE